MKSGKESLEVVVNGISTEVTEPDDAPLETVLAKALEQTKNTGQPPDQWELRDMDGNILDLKRKIGEYQFLAGTVLMLNLKAGVGGHGIPS